METLAFPWLSLMIISPLLGALGVTRLPDIKARRVAAISAALTLVLAIGAALALGDRSSAAGTLDPGTWLGVGPILFIDELSRVLLPFGALVFAVVILAVPRHEAAKVSRSALVTEAAALATFSCAHDLVLVVLWVLGTVPLWLQVRSDARARLGSVVWFFALSAILLGGGVAVRRLVPDASVAQPVGASLVLAAVLIRKGIVPLHSWMPVLFERGPLPAATLFSAPQVGTYVAARLLAPDAPRAVLVTLGALSLFTAVYGAGLALVQRDARRAFGFMFMSQSALTVAGLECASATALAGGLAIWLSSSLALTGLGMALCVLEARRGELSLARWHGGYESTPSLAVGFLLLGLCTVGFPGTLGFVGAELLVDGSVTAHSYVGAAVILASVLNGISALRLYLRLFCGARTPYNPALALRARERVAFATLVAALVVTGIVPQWLVQSRGLAAERLMDARAARGP